MSYKSHKRNLFTGSNCNASYSDGCGLPMPEQPINGFSYRFYVQVQDPLMGEIEREYLLHLPTHYKRSNDVAVSLILDYHGWTSNAGKMFLFNFEITFKTTYIILKRIH